MRRLCEEKVDFSTLIRATTEQAFDAIATAEGMNKWFTTGAELDASPGGNIIFRWRDWGVTNYTGEMSGKVIELNRPERYIFEWEADSRLYFTTVEINFKAVDNGTVVHLIETGYEDSTEGMQDLLNRVAGWAEVLTLMKFYIEHGVTY
jgi:uncharacterized protein YndB with AHSA1/START domain